MTLEMVDERWDEHAAPWDETLGVNQYFSVWIFTSVQVQWLMCGLIWTVTMVWVSTGCIFKTGCMSKFNTWMPILLIVPGHIVFFGFISDNPEMTVWRDYLMTFVVFFASVYFKAGVPFLTGAFPVVLFLLPIYTGIHTPAKIVEYDIGQYSIGVAWPSGLSNACTFVWVRKGWISQHTRWLMQTIGWTTIMSGVPIGSLFLDYDFPEYKLNLVQFVRYSAFQLSIYTFMYYGICNHIEPIIFKETGQGVYPDREETDQQSHHYDYQELPMPLPRVTPEVTSEFVPSRLST